MLKRRKQFKACEPPVNMAHVITHVQNVENMSLMMQLRHGNGAERGWVLTYPTRSRFTVLSPALKPEGNRNFTPIPSRNGDMFPSLAPTPTREKCRKKKTCATYKILHFDCIWDSLMNNKPTQSVQYIRT